MDVKVWEVAVEVAVELGEGLPTPEYGGDEVVAAAVAVVVVAMAWPTSLFTDGE